MDDIKIAPPVVIFKTTSEAFKKKKREGNKFAYSAQILYQEFVDMALRRDNRTIEATESYITNKEKGLGFSRYEYLGAKSLLREMGLIGNSYFNKKLGKHLFPVIFNPMSAKYQEFLQIQSNKKPTKTKENQKYENKKIRSTNSSIQYTTTNYIKDTTTNSSSKEEERSSAKTRKVLINGKIKIVKFNPASKKSKSASISPKIARTKNDINQGSLNLDYMSSVSNAKRSNYKPKHPATSPVVSLYFQLTRLGFTKHREDTKSYFKTIDFLFELLHPEKFKAPYCQSKHNIPDDYRTKQWTVDELVETARFYMDNDQKKWHRNIKDFILAERFNEKSWSPLVNTHKAMLLAQGKEYEGDEKRLFNELDRMSFTKGIGPKQIKHIIRLLDLYCADYHVNDSLNHLYYGRVVFAFGQFVSEKIKQASFKSHYLLSEKVMQEFVDTFSERGVLLRNGYSY